MNSNTLSPTFSKPKVETVEAVRSRGDVVLFHGLNLKPERLHDLARICAGEGLDAHIVYLAGHGDGHSINHVSADQWRFQAKSALEEARLRSASADRGLYVIGYSMGAVLALQAAIDLGIEDKVRFVLLSPALRTNGWTAPLRMLRRLPRLLKSSFKYNDYRANRSLGAKPYLAVLKLVKNLSRARSVLSEIDALIVFDPADELVSARYLKSVRDQQLENLVFLELKNRSDYCPIRHLTMNEEVLGTRAFAELKGAIVEFFKS